jgi:hypothetical protein
MPLSCREDLAAQNDQDDCPMRVSAKDPARIPFWVFIKINDLKKSSDARSGQLAQTGERKNAARC